MIGAHASFTLSDDTLAACVETVEATRASASTSTWPRMPADEDDCRARFGTCASSSGSRAPARWTSAPSLAHAVHLDERRGQTRAGVRRDVVHNARSNMNNAVGRAPLATPR